jgi:hypothetical protein
LPLGKRRLSEAVSEVVNLKIGQDLVGEALGGDN